MPYASCIVDDRPEISARLHDSLTALGSTPTLINHLAELLQNPERNVKSLPYGAKGYPPNAVPVELVIAGLRVVMTGGSALNSEVRRHIEKIYTKRDIHSRKEIFLLLRDSEV